MNRVSSNQLAKLAQGHLRPIALGTAMALLATSCGSESPRSEQSPDAGTAASSSLESELELPATGPVTVAGVELPSGTNVDGRYWVTDQEVADASTAWEELVALYPKTGLFPVLVDPSPRGDVGSWLVNDMGPSVDIAEVRSADVLGIVRRLWSDAQVPLSLRGSLPEEFPELAQGVPNAYDGRVSAPFSGEAHLLLAKVDNPGDVFAVMGWWSNGMETLDIAAVAGSWYERFGWVPYEIGFDTVLLASMNTPSNEHARLLLAGEIYSMNADFRLGESVPIEDELTYLDEESKYFWWD